MATPSEKLVESLEVLKVLHDQNLTAIKTNELSRVHRERLLSNGFIKEIVRGWYITVYPEEQLGNTTSWFASYWHFCARYLNDRFQENYCISAEQSLQLHSGNETVPVQLIIRTTKGTTSSTPLPHGTSLFSMKSSLPNTGEIIEREGIRMLSLPSALIHCSPTMFDLHPTDVRAALTIISDASEVLDLLLEGGHSKIAGRLAGAFRNIGRYKIADDILDTMKSVGYDVRELDPFNAKTPVFLHPRDRSPYVNRVKLMWSEMRKVVLDLLPKAPGLPTDQESFLKRIDEIYVTDAYHSLSIERYKVTPALIERVKSGTWNHKENEEDQKQRDAMAARGYWQARQAVRSSIVKILEGKNSGLVVDQEHGKWYRELFAPSVTARLLKPSDLAGYRNDQVYIGLSKHVPINKDGICDVMPVLFELLENEVDAGVRAVLGYFVFVYTHPYMDGNGRMGRFLMNAMLCSGGYPWTVIPVEQRERYMDALEQASVNQNIEPFARFIAYLLEEGMQGNPVAKIE